MTTDHIGMTRLKLHADAGATGHHPRDARPHLTPAKDMFHMNPIPRAAISGTVAVLAGLGLSGCTGATANSRAEYEPSVAPVPTSRSTRVSHVPELPLDSYRLSTRDRKIIERAEFTLANRCMRERGMSWPAPLEPLGESHSPNERRYGISNATIASSNGYQLPPPVGVTRTEQHQWDQRSKARLASVDRATMNAYTGEGGNGPGCRDRARQELAMWWVYSSDPVSAASGAAWARAKSDSKVRAVNAEWSTCMRTLGHPQPDPLSAAGSWAGAAATSGTAADGSMRAPSAKEIAMALADVKCKHAVDYIARRQAVEAGYQAAEIRSRSTQLQTHRSAWQLSVRKARAVS
ncbi:hypothetical protein ACFU8Q_32450 [Streptomyces sp. NPDC057543]|uniref:hypothetical protein n=1 Tax=Streptomyces sp. NPDC057543 TaxID=3346163 RepID=UPI0036743175